MIDKITKKSLPFGKVLLLDAEENSIETITTGKNASFDFSVSCGTRYRVEGQKEGFESNFKIVATDKKRNRTQEANLTLYSDIDKKKEEDHLTQKRREAEKIAEQKRVAGKKLAKEERIKQEKDEKEKQLRQQKIAEEKQLQAEKIKNKKAAEERKKRIEKAIEKEPANARDGERVVLNLRAKVYFDYDLWYIRLKSKETLDEVIRVINENTGVILEIGTHTDMRGNENYNRELSRKRSNAVMEYLIDSGIDKNRLIGKGYGKTQPMVKCKTEADCTEEQHEKNRRREFVLIKWE